MDKSTGSNPDPRRESSTGRLVRRSTVGLPFSPSTPTLVPLVVCVLGTWENKDIQEEPEMTDKQQGCPFRTQLQLHHALWKGPFLGKILGFLPHQTSPP